MKIGILGSTGVVGREIARQLELNNFTINELKLFCSSKNKGSSIIFDSKIILTQEVCEDSFDELDILFGATSKEVVEKYKKQIERLKGIFIDNSSLYRMNHDVKLIIPEINFNNININDKIIANPNCSTIITLMALFPIHQINNINKIIVTTFQAASGAGQKGMNELNNQMLNKEYDKFDENNVFPRKIINNIIPLIGSIDVHGNTSEEQKMANEICKILKKSILVESTCVRVPVTRAHSMSIYIECENFIDLKKCADSIEKFEGTVVTDVKNSENFPCPLDVVNSNDILVGRIRKSISNNNALSLWCCGDQICKGAATNAVQIANMYINKFIKNNMV